MNEPTDIGALWREMWRDLWERMPRGEVALGTRLSWQDTITAAIEANFAERIEKYREALIWCSGSPSFGPDGEAREGWLRVCQPLLDTDEATR